MIAARPGYARASVPLPGGLARAGVPAVPAGSVRAPPAYRSSNQRKESHGSCLHARAPGGRSPFRPPDPPLEPEDEAVHLRRARRHLHHRPPADARAARGGTRLRPQPRRARRHDPLRRHEEAGAGRDRGAGEARRHAVRQPPLARRPADELAHDLRPHRPPARPAPPEGGGPARAAAREGAHRDARRAREARGEPRRRRRPAPPARRGLHHRPAQGAARGARGAPARHAGHRARRHELRSRRGRLRDPRQRRRDPRVQPDRPRDRRRHRGGQAEASTPQEMRQRPAAEQPQSRSREPEPAPPSRAAEPSRSRPSRRSRSRQPSRRRPPSRGAARRAFAAGGDDDERACDLGKPRQGAPRRRPARG